MRNLIAAATLATLTLPAFALAPELTAQQKQSLHNSTTMSLQEQQRHAAGKDPSPASPPTPPTHTLEQFR